MTAARSAVRSRVPGRDRTFSPARQYTAVAILFALDGAVFGTWAARVPDVAERVGASHSALGTALFCVSLGALISMRLTGTWCARFGPGRVASVAGGLVALSLVAPGFCSDLGALCAALTVFGAATGAANVAANSLGVELGQRRQRPVMSALHALFSFGGLAGALLGGLASTALSVPPHFTAVAVTGVVVATAVRPVLRSLDSAAAPDPIPGSAAASGG
ncbi:MFS transporter, partial [Cryptosporangium japonicum]|uniref:MFS transporter n=1 Tax=Cryptosporangium japonicum TaxID=80872 RepID=UPI0031E3AF09